MGERKGVNKWYPPDYDPSKGGLNKWQGTHALRERAKKIHLGIIIIRFEMPYNIWCEGCGIHIGMGVRYNAEKKKVGMYYTTPVYQFRMKCHLCDNHFEIKTDPSNLDYEIVSGARRQEKRFEASENGTVVPDDKATINKLALDAMYKLEHGHGDAKKAEDSKPRIIKMMQIQDRVKDDYMANRILRDQMRSQRKRAKAQASSDGILNKKMSLDINLLPENDSDIKLASLLKFNSSMSSEDVQAQVRDEIVEESIFDKPTTSHTVSSSTSSKTKTIVDLKKLVRRKRETETENTPSLSSKSLGVTLKKSCTTTPPKTSLSLISSYVSSSSSNEDE